MLSPTEQPRTWRRYVGGSAIPGSAELQLGKKKRAELELDAPSTGTFSTPVISRPC